jgi:class 3 adenylate cyclase/predicted ATPase
MQVCTACNTGSRDGARYCDQCGLRLPVPADPAPPPGAGAGYTPRHLAERILKSRAAMQGERKRVTVLFADIKGSTRLAQAAGAEAWHGILDRYFAILGEAVHRYEGTVNQYTGDGIMALFGAPIAHEDHAQRACLAALAMQQGVKRYAAELLGSLDLQLGTRIGLNSGEVIVGRIGDDLRMDYTAKGLTVNLAARMESLCVPGKIYLSRYTAALVADEFRLLDLDEHRVDGLDHPVRVFELMGSIVGRERLDGSRLTAAHFSGREPEQARLRAALETVRAGQGRIVAISAEAGMGKSRLCQEFAQACEAAGVVAHWSAVLPHASAAPLSAPQMLLRSRLELRDSDSPELMRQRIAAAFSSRNPEKSALIPLLQDFIAADTAAAKPPPAGLRSLMLERVARLLPRAPRPQLLLLEDLHHADPALDDFLRRLCEQVAGTPTLLLLSYRSGYNGDWLRPYLDEELVLAPMSQAQLTQIAAALLGSAPGLQELAARIATRASGNPYFVEEAVKALADDAHIEGKPGAYRILRAVDAWPIPDSVHALIAGRIDHLPESQKNLLQAASVIGLSFRPRLLRGVAGADGEVFARDLAALAETGYVRRHGGSDADPEYVFAQPLLQEVAYQAQLDGQRMQTHAGVAAALESLQPPEAPACEAALAIAHHWAQAEQWHRAGVWNLSAAQWAAPRDAAVTLQQCRLAVQHLDRADAGFEVLRLRIAARAALIRMAQLSEVSRQEVDTAYHDAWKMAEECADLECAAELLFSYAPEKLHRGQAEGAAQLAAEAVSHAASAGCTALLQRFRAAVLLTHNAAGRLREGISLTEGADAGWQRLPVDDGNFIARGFYGIAQAWLGQLAPAREHLEAAIAFAEREGRETIWPHADWVDWSWLSGDTADAMLHAQRAVVSAANFGSPLFKVVAQRALGLAHSLAGDHAIAIKLLEELRPLVAAGALAHPQEASLLTALADAYLGAGRGDDAASAAEAAIASAQGAGARVAELRAWAAYLQMPAPPRRDEGLVRMPQLLELSGAEGLRPWLYLAQAQMAQSDAQRAAAQQRAQLAFAQIGAVGHVTRLSLKTG